MGTQDGSGGAVYRELTPVEAFDLLTVDPAATLVDVRTTAEWTYVGVPDLSGIGREVVLAEWLSFPGGTPNPAFLEQIAAAGADTAAPVMFLCRSGVRSIAAAEAAAAAGWRDPVNILDGFEGPLDGDRHRGAKGGWKAAGLPWRQS